MKEKEQIKEDRIQPFHRVLSFAICFGWLTPFSAAFGQGGNASYASGISSSISGPSSCHEKRVSQKKVTIGFRDEYVFPRVSSDQVQRIE